MELPNTEQPIVKLCMIIKGRAFSSGQLIFQEIVVGREYVREKKERKQSKQRKQASKEKVIMIGIVST